MLFMSKFSHTIFAHSTFIVFNSYFWSYWPGIIQFLASSAIFFENDMYWCIKTYVNICNIQESFKILLQSVAVIFLFTNLASWIFKNSNIWTSLNIEMEESNKQRNVILKYSLDLVCNLALPLLFALNAKDIYGLVLDL